MPSTRSKRRNRPVNYAEDEDTQHSESDLLPINKESEGSMDEETDNGNIVATKQTMGANVRRSMARRRAAKKIKAAQETSPSSMITTKKRRRQIKDEVEDQHEDYSPNDNEDEDDENDNLSAVEDDDSEVILKKTPAPNKQSDGRKKAAPTPKISCADCGKVFRNASGLKYHMENRICKKEKGPKASNKDIGQAPFSILTPGEMFVTPYGVVKVIKDNRFGSDRGKTTIGKDIKVKELKYSRKKDRVMKRKYNMLMHAAKMQRRRRERLKELYLKKKKGEAIEPTKEKPYKTTTVADLVAITSSKSTQGAILSDEIWKLYCDLCSARSLLGGLYSRKRDEKRKKVVAVEKHPWLQFGEDPKAPLDSYPDRIVECVLIQDERKVDKHGKKSQTLSSNTARKSDSKLHESRMKLFLRRRLLSNSYSSNELSYVCEKCGSTFNTLAAYERHTRENICGRNAQIVKSDREARIQEVHDTLDEVIQPLAPLIKIPTPGEKKPPKRKKNKRYPAWLIFSKENTSIYPEVFEFVKFKRGSNNRNFMQAHFDAIGPGRKKMRKSRSKKHPEEIMKAVDEAVSLGVCPKQLSPSSSKRKKKDSLLVHIALNTAQKEDSEHPTPIDLSGKDPDTPSDKANKSLIENAKKGFGTDRSCDIDILLNDETQPVDDKSPMPELPPMVDLNEDPEAEATSPSLTEEEKAKYQEIPPNDHSLKQTDGVLEETPKKRRRRSPTKTVSKPICTPVIIDMQPLLEEVRMGRYPSMKVYKGKHSGICFICKGTENDHTNRALLNCEYCSKSEHLNCLKQKVRIRDPDDNDEFMCHRCIQTVMSRRARAEKRRLQKLDESLGLTAGASNDDCEKKDTGITSQKPSILADTQTKRELVLNHTDSDYLKCPNGGVGGLICCEMCTSSYTQMMNETVNEIETQTVAGLGNEVSELIQLLNDAKDRLQLSIDVTNTNDIRRGLIQKKIES